MTKYWIISWLIVIFSLIALVLTIVYGTNITGITWNFVVVLFAIEKLLWLSNYGDTKP